MSFLGRTNAYVCDQCGRYTVTIDRDEGVTPMFLACRATPECTGRAVSLGYPEGTVPDHIGAPAFEWYRPAERELRDLDAATFEHVARGGLLLRPISGDSGGA